MRLQRDSYAPKSCAFDAANVQFLRAHLCKSHPVLQHRQTASFFNALLYLLLTPFCIIFKRTCVSAFNAHLPSELTQLTHQLCQFLTLHNTSKYAAFQRV